MVFTLRLPRSMSVRTALGGAPLFGAPPGAPLERHGWTVSRRRRSARVGRPVLATNPRRGYFSCPRSRGAPVVVAKNWFGKSRGPRDWRRARSPLLPTCRQRQGSDYILNGTTVEAADVASGSRVLPRVRHDLLSCPVAIECEGPNARRLRSALQHVEQSAGTLVVLSIDRKLNPKTKRIVGARGGPI
jgi:hypothetical protein